MAKIPESELIINKDGSIYHLSLAPGSISDTIITVGDPGRVHLVSQYFTNIDFEMNKREFITHSGTYNGKRITVISTGMGTDNIEVFMTELDALFNIDLKKRQIKTRKKKLKIIRIGTSGSLQEDIPIGTHLVSNYAVGFDAMMQFYKFPQTEFEQKIANDIRDKTGLSFTPYLAKCSESLKKQIAFDMVEGNTITSPGFYAPQGRRIRLELRYPKLLRELNYYHNDQFWLTNFEMETAGYYALAKLFGHEMLSVNAIIANRIKKTISKNPQNVVDSLIRKVLDRI
ncbi:MAG: nucleoside phosphorylase [Bacteroidetes bacterium]|nr:nucleoside phosphorylase [Bacteroidota bacterium]